jgi:hypothetical protein
MALIEIIAECSQDAIYKNPEEKNGFLGAKYIINDLKDKFLINTSQIKTVIKRNEYNYDFKKPDDAEIGFYLVIMQPQNDYNTYCRYFKTEEERDGYYNTLIGK